MSALFLVIGWPIIVGLIVLAVPAYRAFHLRRQAKPDPVDMPQSEASEIAPGGESTQLSASEDSAQYSADEEGERSTAERDRDYLKARLEHLARRFVYADANRAARFTTGESGGGRRQIDPEERVRSSEMRMMARAFDLADPSARSAVKSAILKAATRPLGRRPHAMQTPDDPDEHGARMKELASVVDRVLREVAHEQAGEREAARMALKRSKD